MDGRSIDITREDYGRAASENPNLAVVMILGSCSTGNFSNNNDGFLAGDLLGNTALVVVAPLAQTFGGSSSTETASNWAWALSGIPVGIVNKIINSEMMVFGDLTINQTGQGYTTVEESYDYDIVAGDPDPVIENIAPFGADYHSITPIRVYNTDGPIVYFEGGYASSSPISLIQSADEDLFSVTFTPPVGESLEPEDSNYRGKYYFFAWDSEGKPAVLILNVNFSTAGNG
jgi:hypothetical protein